MKLYIIALLLLALMLAACDGEPTGWASRGIMGEATCPQGQHVIPYGPSGIPACAIN